MSILNNAIVIAGPVNSKLALIDSGNMNLVTDFEEISSPFFFILELGEKLILGLQEPFRI